MSRNLTIGAACFAIASLVGLYSDAWADDLGHVEMQQSTPQEIFLPIMRDEVDDPDSFIWAYIAGVGNDPRPVRRFNTAKQASDYDADGAFRAHWLRRD